MDLGLAGRVAIVTGSSRGIGRACAESLLEEGATVVVTGLNQGRLDTAVKELGRKGKVLGIKADLTKDAEVKALVDQTNSAFGRIDILVNSAASVIPSEFFSIGEEQWTQIFEEKLNGYARTLRHAVPHMRKAKWGRIVNISGVAARQPHSPTVTVGLNNAAVLNLTKGTRRRPGKGRHHHQFGHPAYHRHRPPGRNHDRVGEDHRPERRSRYARNASRRFRSIAWASRARWETRSLSSRPSEPASSPGPPSTSTAA